ncbi:MAG: tetratricopeptide repeat protein [candidate division Zixibacteria bacterium]|nr:tetratricopeptide repeat protein [candidate division Zixibacteria bacterium]
MKTDALLEDESSVVKNVAGLFENGNYQDAVEVLRGFLEGNSENIAALHLLGTAYAKLNDYINAERTFKNELKLDQSNSDAYFNLGLIHSQQNRFSEAIDDFEKVIELKPDDVQALNDLGVINFNLGNTDRSQELFSSALAIDPSCKDAFLNLFELHWNDSKYNQALEYAYSFLQKLDSKSEVDGTDINAEVPRAQVTEAPPSITDSMPTERVKIEAPAVIQSQVMVKTDSAKIDLFNQHVPDVLREKKTGMNIAVVADFNIAGQVTGLFRLINEQTIHRARCIIIQDDYISYDKDIVLSHNNGEDWETAREIIESADFLHIGRFPKQNDKFPLLKYIRPNNTMVQYYGSELRQNAKTIYNWHQQNKIAGLSAWDYTMLENSPFFYHINMMVDTSRIKPAPKPEGTIKIVHPTTNRQIKRTELFVKAVESLQGKYDIEPIIIEGKTNEECLGIKSKAHMTYDQISVGIYGVSAIESMAAGHVVFGGISNFAASIHPDNPIVWITPDNLAEKIEYYLRNKVSIAERGLAGKAWVEKHHNPNKILKQYLYLYDFVKNGHRFMQTPDEQLLG